MLQLKNRQSPETGIFRSSQLTLALFALLCINIYSTDSHAADSFNLGSHALRDCSPVDAAPGHEFTESLQNETGDRPTETIYISRLDNYAFFESVYSSLLSGPAVFAGKDLSRAAGITIPPSRPADRNGKPDPEPPPVSPGHEPDSPASKSSVAVQVPEVSDTTLSERIELFRNQNASTFDRLKRAEALSLSSQLAGLAYLQAIDVWDSGHRPFADYKTNLKRAWTSAPKWDDDHFAFNYIGHPYTGSFTYNLMRSQNASPLASWLFSCSQSLIWEYTLEATEQQPSIQDLLITSNVGSLLGEGAHRLTAKLRENGLSLPKKILLTIINPGHVLNNGYQ